MPPPTRSRCPRRRRRRPQSSAGETIPCSCRKHARSMTPTRRSLSLHPVRAPEKFLQVSEKPRDERADRKKETITMLERRRHSRQRRSAGRPAPPWQSNSILRRKPPLQKEAVHSRRGHEIVPSPAAGSGRSEETRLFPRHRQKKAHHHDLCCDNGQSLPDTKDRSRQNIRSTSIFQSARPSPRDWTVNSPAREPCGRRTDLRSVERGNRRHRRAR